ncbi:putative disease resistance protein RGA1 [Miscanthus floridulus]|uniref:putative disease resistance protein RGA1 n=1 Tax=Miscanthus floridulus TaxID=154761 RepID=UPI0034599EC9
MEAALAAANWLLGQVLNKLSDDLVKAYVSSTELGLDLDKIEREMLYTRALLDEVQGRDFTNKPALQGLLEKLGKKADEAEDALDELHYFIIQDKLDGTQEATPDLGGGLGAKAQHARHAARHTSGNCLSCFSCCRSKDDVAVAMSLDHGGHVEKLPFNRVKMCNKIKQLIEELHSNCTPVSDLLKIVSGSNPQPHMPAFTKRPDTSSQITQEKLFGRDAIFEKTIEEIISVTQSGKTLSVLPIVGPGGIGKTTFTQHLVNDPRIKQCFPDINIWICVSTNFDVLNLTKEILSCLSATENGGNKIPNETTANLDQLQQSIAERLKFKRFLLVLDDIWECSSTEEWEKLLAPLKKDEASGNMILVTTRFPKIAEMVTKGTNPIDLRGLDPNEFWKFFQICAFGRIQDEHGDRELIGIAKQIADKLKCSPLAAKTVGRLLIKKPFQEHWMKILDNKEWLEENHDNDIIPALKISYDYLPFHLKKCFSCFSLFPDDYKFEKLEIICFWDSIGIIDCTRKNKKTEDIGSDYLDELLDNGFLIKGGDNFYVMHDLLHDLSRIVSLEECAYISCSSFDANEIPKTVRYLSIFMHDTHIQNFDEDMGKLKERIDIKNLRSLMIFGEYSRLRLVHILRDTFNEIRGLRVLSIFMNSHSSLPHNFSNLVHLRYLKLISPDYSKVSLPNTVSRFYHLKFLDLKQWGLGSGWSLPKDISRLENLRHFVAWENFHSNVPEVGKMKFLQELKKFHVKKESVGFELGELGKLEELGGVLNIHGLENVRTKQEAKEAKLMSKRNLVKLGLVWNSKEEFTGDDILDSIQPHSNIRRLYIVNHGGSIGPSWLCSNIIYMKNLETLHLESVSWANLPPIGQLYHLRKLKLKKITGISHIGPDFFGGTTEKSFTHLKEVEFCDMPELVEWVGGANCHLFSRLEKISCTDCPMLTTLLFSGWPISSTEDYTIWFPSLHDLCIYKCPKLCLPPLPHTSKVSHIETECLAYYGTSLIILEPYELLVFHNLGDVEWLTIEDAPCFSFMDLQKLHSLRHLNVRRCEETFLRGLDDGVVLHTVQSLQLTQFPLTRKSWSDLFKCFPALSRLDVRASSDEDQEEVVLQFPPSSSLRDVRFQWCKNLILPMDEEEGAGFWGVSSLESVTIMNCDKLFSRWSMGGVASQTHSIIYPLPPCLKELRLEGEQSTLPMALLANLTSLTRLELVNCKDITADGFDPLITSDLERLSVYNWRGGEVEPYSVAADVLAAVARTTKTMPAGSFQLVGLHVDSISAVLVAPICSRLSATLQRLSFVCDWRTENFTEEQDEELQLLTSLQTLSFSQCSALRSLPQGLHRLPSLQELRIWGTQKIRSLPKEGLPDSLRLLQLHNCSPEIYEECQKLRGTRPDIDVSAFIAEAES